MSGIAINAVGTDQDVYGRGFDGIFGRGAEASGRRLALLSLIARKAAREESHPGDFIEYDYYGRADPRIFGADARNTDSEPRLIENKIPPFRQNVSRSVLAILPGKKLHGKFRRHSKQVSLAIEKCTPSPSTEASPRSALEDFGFARTTPSSRSNNSDVHIREMTDISSPRDIAVENAGDEASATPPDVTSVSSCELPDDFPRRVKSRLPSEEVQPQVDPGTVARAVKSFSDGSEPNYRLPSDHQQSSSLAEPTVITKPTTTSSDGMAAWTGSAESHEKIYLTKELDAKQIDARTDGEGVQMISMHRQRPGSETIKICEDNPILDSKYTDEEKKLSSSALQTQPSDSGTVLAPTDSIASSKIASDETRLHHSNSLHPLSTPDFERNMQQTDADPVTEAGERGAQPLPTEVIPSLLDLQVQRYDEVNRQGLAVVSLLETETPNESVYLETAYTEPLSKDENRYESSTTTAQCPGNSVTNGTLTKLVGDDPNVHILTTHTSPADPHRIYPTPNVFESSSTSKAERVSELQITQSRAESETEDEYHDALDIAIGSPPFRKLSSSSRPTESVGDSDHSSAELSSSEVESTSSNETGIQDSDLEGNSIGEVSDEISEHSDTYKSTFDDPEEGKLDMFLEASKP